MNKLIRGALALTMVSTTISMANNDFYVGIGTAIESVDNELIDDTGISMELKVGKVFTNNIGIEGKITKTMSPAEDEVTITQPNGFSYNADLEADLTTYSLWGTYNLNLMPELTIIPKIGYLKEKVKLDARGFKNSVSDDGVVFGLDIQKDFTQSGFSIYAGFSKIEDDVNHLSFGILKNF